MFKYPIAPPPHGGPEHDHCHHPGHPFDRPGMFPPDRPRYTITENVEHATREMRETIARLLAFEQRMKDDFDGMLRHLTQDNVTFKDTFYQGYQTFIQAVENEINDFQSNVDNSIKLFVDNLNADFEKFTTDANDRITANEEKYVELLNAHVAECNEKYDAFIQTYETAFAEFKTLVDDRHAEFVRAVNLRLEENTERYNAFLESVNDRCDSHEQAVNSRLDAYYETYSQAFADYQQKMTTELNLFEATVNSNFETFSNGITDSLNAFKLNWEEIITTRLNAQDGRIADAELYMKTNLNATVRTELGDMILTGEFDQFFDEEFMEEAAEHHQLKIEFVDSVDEMVNSKTLYVLDGFIWQYRATEDEDGNITYAWENTGKTFVEIFGEGFGGNGGVVYVNMVKTDSAGNWEEGTLDKTVAEINEIINDGKTVVLVREAGFTVGEGGEGYVYEYYYPFVNDSVTPTFYGFSYNKEGVLIRVNLYENSTYHMTKIETALHNETPFNIIITVDKNNGILGEAYCNVDIDEIVEAFENEKSIVVQFNVSVYDADGGYQYKDCTNVYEFHLRQFSSDPPRFYWGDVDNYIDADGVHFAENG